MKQRLLQSMLLLFFCTAILAQQPEPQLPNPSIPDANVPNTKSDHHQMSSKDVAEKLQKGLESKNAAYAGSNIRPVVNDQSVILNGTVSNESQHEMALQLVRAYAGDRRIVDRLIVQP